MLIHQNSLRATSLREMLALQDELNSVINSDWVSAKNPFLRAAFVEAAEALDHHGWKWWKSQAPDFYQLQMELIDILHFYLSDVLVEFNADMDFSIKAVMTEINEDGVSFDGVNYNLAELDILRLLELLGAMAAARRRSFAVLHRLMERCSLGWDEAFQIYVSKNILNLFRQANGYKDGSYIKIWRGEEDNVWLERLAKNISADLPDYTAQLRQRLAEEYLKVKNEMHS